MWWKYTTSSAGSCTLSYQISSWTKSSRAYRQVYECWCCCSGTLTQTSPTISTTETSPQTSSLTTGFWPCSVVDSTCDLCTNFGSWWSGKRMNSWYSTSVLPSSSTRSNKYSGQTHLSCLRSWPSWQWTLRQRSSKSSMQLRLSRIQCHTRSLIWWSGKGYSVGTTISGEWKKWSEGLRCSPPCL